MDMKEEIGKRIESIRKEMKMTKEKFAKEIGISGQYLGIVEKGRSSLAYDKLKKLCDISGYSADYILFGIDKNLPKKTKVFLKDFTDEQISEACNILAKIGLFIKNNK